MITDDLIDTALAAQSRAVGTSRERMRQALEAIEERIRMATVRELAESPNVVVMLRRKGRVLEWPTN